MGKSDFAEKHNKFSPGLGKMPEKSK